MNLILFALGFVLLIKGSDYFVKNASIIAKKIGVSEFVIGLTLVAIGTSLPELASSLFASYKGQSGIILGEIIGSNIANIGLIAGIMAILAVVVTKKEMLVRDGYFLLFTVILFFAFLLNGFITPIIGVAFLIIYVAYLAFLFESSSNHNERDSFEEFINYFIKFKYIGTVKKQIKRRINPKKSNEKISLNLLVLVVSGVFIFLGAKLLVEQAIFFADLLAISTNIIGLTLIAFGTSLPELSISISAIKNKLGSIALGNIIGSCIANILLVIGVSSFINPIIVDRLTLLYTAPFMLFISALLLFFMQKNHKLTKKHGIIFIVFYVLFLMSLIFLKINP